MREAVIQRATVLDVPLDALEAVVAAPAVVETTLQEYHRPIVGGLQIELQGGFCTFTANVWLRPTYFTVDSTNNYFITNSHCTNDFGTVTAEQVGQPTLAREIIGWEVWDPPLFDSSDPRYPGLCPPGRRCRLSDAAMFYMQDLPGDWDYWPWTIASATGITIQYYVGLWQTSHPLSGMRIYKVGRTTGETWGWVVGTCQDVPQYEEVSPGVSVDTGRTMLCQGRGSYTSLGGDSGSPVVQWPGDYPVNMLGVHWGRGGYFSNWNQVDDELARAAGVSALRVSHQWP